MRVPKFWVLLLGLWTTGACSVPWVELGDVQERVERREIKRQLRLLSSQDESIWQAAYWRLVERGDQAVPHLMQAFDAREPLASRSVLVMGDIASEATIVHLRALQQDPRLGSSARQALGLSEEALWRAVTATGERAACESYLTWFPGGQYRWEVQRRLAEVDAIAAYASLENKASEEAIALFLKDFGATEIGGEVRRKQAQKAKDRASALLGEGDLQGAHLALQQAQRLDPELELSGLESKIRSQIGRIFAEENRIDEAIGEFSRALELGEPVEMELGRLLVDRSRSRQEERDFLNALRDLHEARRVYASLDAVVKRRLRSLERQLLVELDEGRIDGNGVAESLLLAGEESREALRQRLRNGTNITLIEALVSHAAGSREPEPVQQLRGEAVALFQARSLERAEAFLTDSSRIDRLMDGEKLWHPSQGPSRDEARRVAADVNLGQVWAWKVREGNPGLDAEASFIAELRTVAERNFLLEGHRPDLARWGAEDSAQSLGLMMALHSELQQLVENNPLAFAAGLVGRERLPADLAEWGGIVLGEFNPNALQIRNGAPAALSVPSHPEGLLVLRLDVTEGDVSSEEAVSEALTILFGVSRSLVQHHPDIDGVQVEVYERGRRRVRVALTRDSIRRINWPLIQAETPFGPEHLVFVFDQEVD
ncbi:MAG: hypothetical protein VXW32_16570 [Myxococcota bacterium]|nr:hypothetical protein [Myxococcota bacterium]